MTLIIDAGALVAQADADHPEHDAVVTLLRGVSTRIVTSQMVAAEADHLILKHLGVDVELAFLSDLAGDTFAVECLTPAELATAHALASQYRNLRLGLADASLIVLAGRHRTTRIATFDQRSFRPVTPLQGGAFTILPADTN